VLLMLATLALTYWVYGRGTRLWEISPRFKQLWGGG
jgi:hypothetical protein